MITFYDPLFWLNFIYFFVAVFVAFFIPGNLLLRNVGISFFQRIIISIVLGMVLWSLQGMIFGFFNIRWVSYVYIFVVFILWLKFNIYNLYRFPQKTHIDKVLTLIIITGTLIQILTVWFIGVYNQEGLSFCCFWSDSFYHLALTNQLVQHVPPFEPGMSDVIVRNYHYLANLIIAELIRVFNLPLLDTQYRYIPVLLSVLLGLSAVSFASALKLNRSFARWFVFFLYFSGDIIFVLLFLLGHGVNFSLNISENATTLWFSPARVFAMVILFSGMSLFLFWLRKKDYYSGFLIAILFGSLVGFKIYIGIFVLSGWAVLSLFFLYKKDFKMVLSFLTAVIISALLYFPINKNAGGLFFVGFWRIEDFAVKPIWGLLNFELARRVYLEHGNYIKVALIESFYLVLYFFSLGGMFLFGLLQTKKSLSLFPKELHILLLSGFSVSVIAGLFFLQKTGGANTLQFLFMVYIIGSIYAALSFSYLLNKIRGKQRIIIIFIIAILVSGRVIREVYYNVENLIEKKGFFVVNKQELEAFHYINVNVPKNALILIDEHISMQDPCYRISFMTDRPLYLCGNGILTDHGVDTKERVSVSNEIFKGNDTAKIKKLFYENNIQYIYLSSDNGFAQGEIHSMLKPVFKNSKIILYKVLKNNSI